MTQGRLQQVISSYRQQLTQQEQAAERALTDAYQATLATLQPQLNALMAQIAAKQQAGEAIPISWLYEAKRLQAIDQFIVEQMNHYGLMTQNTVDQLQQQGVQLGLDAAQAQLDALVPPGMTYLFGTPSPQALASLVGATQRGSPLADLFNGFGTEAASNANDALILGITLGKGAREVALAVQQALDVSLYRALTISRTELLRAYRGGNLETYRANSDIVREWRWVAAKSTRTCAACLAMDGTLHPLDEEMQSHVNCRCTCAPVPIAAWAQSSYQSGSDWLDSQDEEAQRAILGAKYDGWSNGDFTLQDMVGVKSDPNWGSSIYEKSLKQLTDK